MNMRNIYKGESSRDTDKGEPWAHLWSKTQHDAEHPTTIIYGHDARRVPSFINIYLIVGITTSKAR